MTKAMKTKCSKVTQAEKKGKRKDTSKGKKMPKGKPRSLGCGTHQRPEHAPRVV